MTLQVVFYRKPDDLNAFRASKVEINYQRFSWVLTNKHYECVHGFFRVLLMLPDKLATALRVRELELPDPEDDGQFLIRLLLDLLEVCYSSSQHFLKQKKRKKVVGMFFYYFLQHYIALSGRIENVVGDDPLDLLEAEYTFPEFYGIVGPTDESANFRESLSHLQARLTSLISKLPLRNLALDMHIGDILIWANFARLACLAYLKFAHPIYVISSRLREFDRRVADDRRREFVEEAAAQRSLAEEFADFRRV